MAFGPSEDPELERSFFGQKGKITCVSFRSSMTQMASGSTDNSVMVWNFPAHLRAYKYTGHTGPITSVHFSPSGRLLASSSKDCTVRLWTPRAKGEVSVFKAHTSAVRAVQFSKDGKSLLTASDDKSIKIWSTKGMKFQHSLLGHLNWVKTACFSPNSKLVLSGSDDKTVKLWDVHNKTCIKTFWVHKDSINNVQFHSSGSIIASCSDDNTIKLIDIRMNKLIQLYENAHEHTRKKTKGVTSISFGGADNEYLSSSGVDGLIKIWDLKEGHLLYTLYGHKKGPTLATTFSNEGNYFATTGCDEQVLLWKSNFKEEYNNENERNYSTYSPSMNDKNKKK
ncbi:POC1 centriolar protein-like protein A-like protein [Neocallimastix californiae]|uniref:POC1 centriolar protein-like protein A-like protein n=1 Tax=Neocallimastix californiae TaxID=1754190 RepID=A0A1Y2CN21_9FUNG|nr:POC1 centriolar protein-like protein A-like protein [Neocallimastix californiae]|eukprot:ORY48357.1 POC1 centriolar protein-like protein A-like protein [Neocallimastix californiae]